MNTLIRKAVSRIAVISFFAGAVIVSGVLNAHAQPVATLYVNANATSSGSGTIVSPFQTIQAAVNAASSGDVINVASGTYTEAVSITKDLTIVGAGALDTIIKAPADLPSEGVIVNVNGSGVRADISGFTIEGPGSSGCGSLMAGVFVSNGAYADIHNATIKDIRDNPLSGCQNGRAVLVGWGHGSIDGMVNTTGTATVDNVTISDYQKSGIEVDGAGSSATITDNSITGVGATSTIAQNGIEVLYGAAASVSGNTVTGNIYTNPSTQAAGILLYDPATSTTVGPNAAVTGNQFGLWTNGQLSLSGVTTTGISGNARDAIAYTDGWSAPTETTVNAAMAGIADANGGDIVPGGVVGYNVFPSIQSAINALPASGGTVHVMAGTYSGDVTVPGPDISIIGSGNPVINLGSGYGINLNTTNDPSYAPTNFTMTGVTVNASPETTFALKAYHADGLTLANDVFNGGVGNMGDGVDINTTSHVILNNVTSTGFHHNGFAITAAYTASDTAIASHDITFNGITATDNGWAGIAFYTVGGDGGAASIAGVNFAGTDIVAGNNGGSNGGVFLEGDSDANVIAGKTPAYTVTTDGVTLDLTHLVFGSGNAPFDILNYQTAPVNAVGATFGGLTGNMMTPTQHAAENVLIYDHLDNPSLGLVTYYVPDTKSPTAQFTVTPPMYVNGNFHVSGTASDDVALQSVFFDVRDLSIANGNSWAAGCVGTSTVLTYSPTHATATIACDINTADLAEGHPYTLRIHAGDYAGYGGGSQQTLIVDRTRPNGSLITPANSSTQEGSFTVMGTATDSISGIDHVDIYVAKVVAPNAQGNTFGGYAVDDQPASWNAASGTFTYDVSGLANGNYVVKADAFDRAGNDHVIGSANIQVINTLPSTPTLSWPVNGDIVPTSTFYFKWNPSTSPVAGPITYQFHSTLNPAEKNGVLTTGLWISPILTTSSILSKGAPDGTWYWQVRAQDANGTWSNWSDIWRMTINTAPVSVLASCPAGTSPSLVETDLVNSASSTPTLGTHALTNGHLYLVVASGTWANNSFNVADPAYASVDHWTTYMQGDAIHSLGSGEFQLQVGGNFVNWGAYQPTHTYAYLYTGTGSPISLMVFDGNANLSPAKAYSSWYPDNSGTLSVAVYACNAPLYVTTSAATDITPTDATLNGVNGDYPAGGHSFWVSTSTFSTSSPNIPEGVYSTFDMGSIASDTAFSATLSSLAVHAYVFGQKSGTMPPVHPGMTYYYAAWTYANGAWHAGSVQSFTTPLLSSDATLSALGVSEGALSPSFTPGQNTYSDLLPYGTLLAPTVTATTTDTNATATILQATSTTGAATIDVTAQNGTTTKRYSVAFSLAPATSSILNVALKVVGGGPATSAADFAVSLLASDASTSTFPGNAAGTSVTIAANQPYFVNVASLFAGSYIQSTEGACDEVAGIPGGNAANCTITEAYNAPVHSSLIVGVGAGIGGVGSGVTSNNGETPENIGGGSVLGASISGNQALQVQLQFLEQQLVKVLEQYLAVLQGARATH